MIATRPATAPEAMPSTDGLPLATHSTSIQATAAAAAAMWVDRHRHARTAVGGQREPALNPNQPTHSSDVPIRVRVRLCGRHGLLAVADPLAEHDAADQPGDAGIDVHDGAAGEVEHAGAEQEAVGRPDPVRDRRIDDDRPQDHEHQHRRELHPVDEGADDQRRRDHDEGHLEHHEDRLGNDRRVPGRSGGDGLEVESATVHGQSRQHGPAEVADILAAVGERQSCSRRSSRPARSRRRWRRPASAPTARSSCGPCRHRTGRARDGHHQHQGRGGHHPGGVAGVDRRHLGHGG